MSNILYLYNSGIDLLTHTLEQEERERRSKPSPNRKPPKRRRY